jgi:two-component system, NarL family, sensor histidine kinase DegS
LVNPKARKILLSPNFWIIALLVCGIIFLYYYYPYPKVRLTTGLSEWLWNLLLFELQTSFHGSLLLIPMLYALLRFGSIGGLFVWALCITIMFPYLAYWNLGISSLILNIVLLSIVSLGIGFFIMILKWQGREVKITAERESQRQTYMSQVFKAHEEERAHIAHELHDETIQILVAMLNRVQSIRSGEFGSVSPVLGEQLDQVHGMASQISQEVRRLSRDLRPSILDNLGLTPALSWLVNQLERSNEVEKASLIFSGTERKLKPEADVIIFRIVQEALNNIKHHAEAKNIIVSMLFEPRSIMLTIKDDGRGFVLPEKIDDLIEKGKLGLIGMQQRVKFLDGNFNVHSAPNEGTTISIIFKNI